MEKRRSFKKARRTFRSWRRWAWPRSGGAAGAELRARGSLSPPRKAQRLGGGEGRTVAVHVSSLWNKG